MRRHHLFAEWEIPHPCGDDNNHGPDSLEAVGSALDVSDLEDESGDTDLNTDLDEAPSRRRRGES